VKHLQRQVEEEQRMRAELQDEADRIRAQVGSEESTTSGAEEPPSLYFFIHVKFLPFVFAYDFR